MTTQQWEFEDILSAYNAFGMELLWTKRDFTEIKICDMDDNHINNTLGMLNKAIRYDKSRYKDSMKSSSEEWVEVFTDVQFKRRIIKLNKLKDNINAGRTN